MFATHAASSHSAAHSMPVSGTTPLSMVDPGRSARIHSIRGKDKTRQFLEGLGFVEGAEVAVLTELNGSVIVLIKESRVAVSKAMASRILTD